MIDTDIDTDINTDIGIVRVCHIRFLILAFKAGNAWVNCYGVLDPSVSFGCYKMSGYGSKGGPQHVGGFLYQKVVYINGN